MLRASFVQNFNQNVRWIFRERLHHIKLFEKHNNRLIEIAQKKVYLSPFDIHLDHIRSIALYLNGISCIFLYGCGYRWYKPKEPSSKPVKDKFRTSNHKNIIELVKNDTK